MWILDAGVINHPSLETRRMRASSIIALIYIHDACTVDRRCKTIPLPFLGLGSLARPPGDTPATDRARRTTNGETEEHVNRAARLSLFFLPSLFSLFFSTLR